MAFTKAGTVALHSKDVGYCSQRGIAYFDSVGKDVAGARGGVCLLSGRRVTAREVSRARAVLGLNGRALPLRAASKTRNFNKPNQGDAIRSGAAAS